MYRRRRNVRLTSEQFENIGFGEAHLFIKHPSAYKRDLYITVWGINSTLANLGIEDIIYPADTQIYVSGMVNMIFRKPKDVEIDVMLYKKENGSPIQFLEDKEGRFISENVKWTQFNEIDGQYPTSEFRSSKSKSFKANDSLYVLQGVSHFPYGYCQMKVRTNSSVRLQFWSDCEFIPVNAYSANPQIYSYRDDKTIY